MPTAESAHLGKKITMEPKTPRKLAALTHGKLVGSRGGPLSRPPPPSQKRQNKTYQPVKRSFWAGHSWPHLQRCAQMLPQSSPGRQCPGTKDKVLMADLFAPYGLTETKAKQKALVSFRLFGNLIVGGFADGFAWFGCTGSSAQNTSPNHQIEGYLNVGMYQDRELLVSL